MNGDQVDTRPVGPAELSELAELFGDQRNTRHCWCTAFCLGPRQFALGWLTGGNRRHFEAMAATWSAPMGILVSSAGAPVAWCAAGPRSRYATALDGRGSVMADRNPREDESVWLLPCLFVDRGHRGQGITSTLVAAAVELARREGAVAIEGWPHAGSDPKTADAFLGREQVFADRGFRCIGRPRPDRAIMRLDF